MRRLLFISPIFLLVSACSAEEGNGASSPATAASGNSDVADIYSKSFDRAWQAAGEGRSPTGSCSGVFGKAVGLVKTTATVGKDRTDAIAAMDACYVSAMARYVEVTLSVENPGPEECINLISSLAIHRSSLGAFFDDVGEDVAAYDSRLNEQIETKVRTACPDSAKSILGA